MIKTQKYSTKSNITIPNTKKKKKKKKKKKTPKTTSKTPNLIPIRSTNISNRKQVQLANTK
jgi:hypothetical protein